jgi:DNA-binding XRE family transcriptional regulator
MPNLTVIPGDKPAASDGTGFEEWNRLVEIRRAIMALPPLDYKAIGQRLQSVRMMLRMSIPEAAEVAGVTPRTFRRWEKGQPSRDYLAEDFCHHFGVSVDWLWGRSRVDWPFCQGVTPGRLSIVPADGAASREGPSAGAALFTLGGPAPKP